MMIEKIVLFGRRQLHTIVSRELVKPSSPTPSHLRTYNLSQLDQYASHAYVPLILFYPNNKNCNLTSNGKTQLLKKSLSYSLTQYYPFAGRLHTPTSPYIDCNDEGVLVIEAKHEFQLDKLQHISVKDDSFGQLFADGMVFKNSPHKSSLVGVQINHFSCGGMAVAVSMSHRIGDGCTFGSYLHHWASMARYGSIDHKKVLPINPNFIQSPANTYSPSLEDLAWNQRHVNRVTRKFVFPNSKLNELKNKVLVEAGSTPSIYNPTRVEVLTSLIYKTVVTSSTTNLSSFKPSFLIISANIRKKLVPKLPQTTVGNFFTSMLVATRHVSETSISRMVSEIKKEKRKLERVQSLQMAFENTQSVLSRLQNEDLDNVGNIKFLCSSLCGFPFNEIDFGWGKPSCASIEFDSLYWIGSVLMDAPDRNGIEALVMLEKQSMEIFENDKELLSFCQ